MLRKETKRSVGWLEQSEPAGTRLERSEAIERLERFE
jgi:hypothetical protein